ncbi:MAG: hypothetical protein WC934_04785 [Acidithiobacillus sp.]|jgi:hypothetical protein|uniref:hypothetical protein n=1 Tax=Acidithiobacillus sp. TaxID=1872118 RepID=UPI00355EC8DB
MAEQNEFAITSIQYNRLRRILLCSSGDFPTLWKQNDDMLEVTITHSTWDSKYEVDKEEEYDLIFKVPILAISSDEHTNVYIDHENLIKEIDQSNFLLNELKKGKELESEIIDKVKKLANEIPINAYNIKYCTERLNEIKYKNKNTNTMYKITQQNIAKIDLTETLYNKLFLKNK